MEKKKSRGYIGRGTGLRVEEMRNVCQPIKTTRFAKNWRWGMRDKDRLV